MPTDVGSGGDVGSIAARLGIDRAGRIRDDAFEDLSSGQKYQRAEENPAAVALALALQAQQGGMQGGIKNASEGVAMLQTAEAGYDGVSDVLMRMRELAVSAINGGLNNTARGAMDTEFQALSKSLDRIAGSSEYNGQSLLNPDGGQANLSFQVGDGGGSSSRIDLELESVGIEALGLAGASLDSPSEAMESLASIDKAIRSVDMGKSQLGSTMAQLGGATDMLFGQYEAASGSLMSVQGVGYGEETSQLASSQIMEQMAVALLAQSNVEPSIAQRLLG